MKTHELRSLQALRQLREQRAASQLVAQQRQCQQTQDQLTLARQRLHLHREQLACEAQQMYGALVNGMSVACWQTAQLRLDGGANEQLQLERQAHGVTRELDEQMLVREGLRLEHLGRQNQCEAWDTVVGLRQRAEQRAAEHHEDADEGVPTPAAVEGVTC